MARILLLQVESNLADQLSFILAKDRHEILQADELGSAPPNADVIFAGVEGGSYKKHLADAQTRRPHVPFIVVTRFPETEQWLDALEAGATDYCAAPFEQRQIRWLLESVLRRAA
jgi:DNA-binding response OmpR family regulator